MRLNGNECMTARMFTSLEKGFSILKCGEKFNLNYPVFKNGQEYREFKTFDSFIDALKYYEGLRHEQTE